MTIGRPSDGGARSSCKEEEEEEVPVQRQLCDRFDECNYFAAGTSVADCTDVLTMCSDDLLTSERTDWERAASDALENANCTNFIESYQEAPACTIADDGTIGGGGGSGGSASDGSASSGENSCGGVQRRCSGGDLEVCVDGQLAQVSCGEVCDVPDSCDAFTCEVDDVSGMEDCLCAILQGPMAREAFGECPTSG